MAKPKIKHLRNKAKNTLGGFCGVNPEHHPDFTNDPDEATCKTCKLRYEERRREALWNLRAAIKSMLVTKSEYHNLWNEVLVEQVMDT
jgi:hypothetical protein